MCFVRLGSELVARLLVCSFPLVLFFFHFLTTVKMSGGVDESSSDEGFLNGLSQCSPGSTLPPSTSCESGTHSGNAVYAFSDSDWDSDDFVGDAFGSPSRSYRRKRQRGGQLGKRPSTGKPRGGKNKESSKFVYPLVPERPFQPGEATKARHPIYIIFWVAFLCADLLYLFRA